MSSLIKKPTIGFKYHIGMHLVVSQAPIDHILAIKWQDAIAWEGVAASGSIQIQKPELFGGAKKEGGVSGQIDILPGDATQAPNDYLQSAQGGAVPAYRGVASLVLRQVYIGNNPFLKPISVKVKNVHSTFGGWLPDLAPINAEVKLSASAIYIAMDYSGSMAGSAAANQAASVKGFLEGLKGQVNDVKLVAYNFFVLSNIERFGCSDSDYDDLIAWVDTLPVPYSSTDYEVAVSQSDAFFTAAAVSGGQARLESWADQKGLIAPPNATGDSTGGIASRKILVFLSDGVPSEPVTATDAAAILTAIDDLEVFAININSGDTTYTALLDNTPLDSVPVVSSEDPDAIRIAMSSATGSWVDLNPAHILRDLIISPSSGGDGNSASIGTSFSTAAATLFGEGLGLSFLHENPGQREDFKKLVERHIDGSVYFDRATGLWELKLIRPDYAFEVLHVFDASNVIEFVDVARPLQEDLPNQITIVYTKREDGKTASLTVNNVAAIQMLGQVIPDKVEYLGVTVEALAARLAARDLVALTVPLWAGSIRVTFAPMALNIGWPFILNEPRLGINNVVCRVTEIEEGDGRDNSVLIRFVEDRFAAEIDTDAFVPDTAITSPDTSVKPPNVSLIDEVPYWLLAQSLGQVEIDSRLALDPDAGFYQATCDKPAQNHIDADIGDSVSGAWAAVATTDFAPAAALRADLSPAADVVSFELDYNDSLILIQAGDLCQIGGEIMRVDAMSIAADIVTVTVGRGCLDTVPANHSAAEWVIFWFGNTASDEVQYTAGQTLNLAVFPKTTRDILPIAQAQPVALLMDSRANRPYPPGKLQVNGSFANALAAGPLAITWAHRDRTIQTATYVDDHTADNIGPEAGVTYLFRAALVDAAGAELIVFVDDQDMGVATTAAFDLDDYQNNFFLPSNYFNRADFFGSTLPDAGVAVRLSVKSKRGIYESWQAAFSDAHIFLAPTGLTLTEII